ncbi:unannotated protein [freshwater metagenome]|uniref:Unannotated protein n=1 Tax=freshwater metagenome TaxID=449393 RepID=A0A6J6B118_9ZZZZ|nr:uridine diphosphate-N-acetylglucosamine-binding protein YvcK [Actinomycetota bacterium]
MSGRSPKVVALGGGHGLAATLSALRGITSEITAIVTVADNGGSSGRLREEFSIYPPGDLRMALAALCSDDEWGRSWAQIMQYRFQSDGELNGHAVGNLLLAALWNKGEDPVSGLDRVGSLLKVIGRVLPMSQEPLDIEATFTNSTGRFIVKGQVQVATAKGRLESLRLLPENPSARSEALGAIVEADWIVMGPGSWFSSVLPHLLVPQQREALIASKAKKFLVLNLDSASSNSAAANPGEYAGYTPIEHIEILRQYAPGLKFDYIIADESLVGQGAEIEKYLSSTGSELVVADLRDGSTLIHHDPRKLTSLLTHMARQMLVG